MHSHHQYAACGALMPSVRLCIRTGQYESLVIEQWPNANMFHGSSMSVLVCITIKIAYIISVKHCLTNNGSNVNMLLGQHDLI